MRNGLRCVWCGVELTQETAQIDHVVQRATAKTRAARRALDVNDNLVASCMVCNVVRPEEIELDPGMLAAPLDYDAGRRLALRWYPWLPARDAHSRAMKKRAAARRKTSREQAIADGLGGAAFPFGEAAE